MAELQPDVKKQKDSIRREVWATLEKYEVAAGPRPCYGKIPAFLGINNIALRLVKIEVFRQAKTVFATPEPSTRVIREESLRRGKNVILSIPGFRGYVLLDPHVIDAKTYAFASTLRGALKYGEKIGWTSGFKADVVVIGSVAANRDGARLGRGDGVNDLEYAILRELHAITEKTPVITPVHDLQVVDKKIPMLRHDVPADVVVTPTQIITPPPTYPKPPGIIWELLPIDMVKSTPILRMLFGIS